MNGIFINRRLCEQDQAAAADYLRAIIETRRADEVLGRSYDRKSMAVAAVLMLGIGATIIATSVMVCLWVLR
jgi:hypothetical protein